MLRSVCLVCFVFPLKDVSLKLSAKRNLELAKIEKHEKLKMVRVSVACFVLYSIVRVGGEQKRSSSAKSSGLRPCFLRKVRLDFG